MRYPVSGSAFPATSGTPRPTRRPGFAEGGTLAPFCQSGSPKRSLTPPPVAPPAPSFHAVSDAEPLPRVSRVPPQASACGLEAGKSACARPSSAPSPEPPSPEAQQTVTPSSAASWSAPSNASTAWRVQLDSGEPQLIETTDGRRDLSCSAASSASRNPRSVLGAK